MSTDIATKTTKMDIKKTQAVELWRDTQGHITNICAAIGIARSTFYDWMKDPTFAMQLMDAEAELNDEIRDALIRKAADGDLGAIIFYLKKRHPDFLEKPTQPGLTLNANQMVVEFGGGDGN